MRRPIVSEGSDPRVLEALAGLGRQIAAVQRDLGVLLERQRDGRLRSGELELLAAIAAIDNIEMWSFNSADVVAHAKVSPALQTALVACGCEDNARKLGKVFHRIVGVESMGLRLVRLGDDRDGAVWALRVSLPDSD